MGEERYMLSAEKQKEEDLIRWFRLQEIVVDPVTIRHLVTIGVANGWRCLEVGAGLGSIAQWLSRSVGPAGKVVATDIDTRFLQGLSEANLEVLRHDILKDNLEIDEYDLVHCRKLLHHLPGPEKAVKKMADAVRPGGWLLIEEDDYGSMLSADVTDPSAVPFTDVLRVYLDGLRRRGIADYYVGRRMRSLVENLGFVEVGQEGWTMMVRGSDPIARYHEESWQKVGKTLIAEGIITQEQHQIAQRVFVDPDFCIPFYTLFCAWGRKPVRGGI